MIKNKFIFRRELFFVGIGSVAVFTALTNVTHNVILIWTIFILSSLICLFFPFVRCENCDVLLFRYNSARYGIPHPKFAFPVRHCPVCHSNLCVLQALPREPT